MSNLYLDYNSTTPVDLTVLEQMMPWFSDQFGNAASHTHAYGWQAAEAVKIAREQVAALIAAEPGEIVFTSGATESINLALRGLARAWRGQGCHIISVSTEHKAVLDTLKDMEADQVSYTLLPVDRVGRIDLYQLEKSILPETRMICVMMANNETGTLQDTEAIGKICRERKIIFFSDTTQAIGKIRVNVHEIGFGMCCLSAHKFYGPKGVGALYISRKDPRVTLQPIITGGGHERGLRSGTLNVPGIVGMGAAAKLAQERQWDDAQELSRLRVLLEQGLQHYCNVTINGDIRNRLPNTTNVTFPNMRADALMKKFPQVAMSAGSACTSALQEPSHVLTAMGIRKEACEQSVRFSVGRNTTQDSIMQLFETLNQRKS
jgi:cysteine desulfurase